MLLDGGMTDERILGIDPQEVTQFHKEGLQNVIEQIVGRMGEGHEDARANSSLRGEVQTTRGKAGGQAVSAGHDRKILHCIRTARASLLKGLEERGHSGFRFGEGFTELAEQLLGLLAFVDVELSHIHKAGYVKTLRKATREEGTTTPESGR